MNDADNHAVGVELVCGSCRYYQDKACHVDPPQLLQWRPEWVRPCILPDDTACASFRAPVELLDRLRRQREEAAVVVAHANRFVRKPNPSKAEGA